MQNTSFLLKREVKCAYDPPEAQDIGQPMPQQNETYNVEDIGTVLRIGRGVCIGQALVGVVL